MLKPKHSDEMKRQQTVDDELQDVEWQRWTLANQAQDDSRNGERRHGEVEDDICLRVNEAIRDVFRDFIFGHGVY